MGCANSKNTRNKYQTVKPETAVSMRRGTLFSVGSSTSLSVRKKFLLIISKDQLVEFENYISTHNINFMMNIGLENLQFSILHYCVICSSYKIFDRVIFHYLSAGDKEMLEKLLNLIDQNEKTFYCLASSDYQKRIEFTLNSSGIDIDKSKKNSPPFFFIKETLHKELLEKRLFNHFKDKVSPKSVIYKKIMNLNQEGSDLFYDSEFAPIPESFSSSHKNINWERFNVVKRCKLQDVTLFRTPNILKINCQSKVICSFFLWIKDYPDFIRSLFTLRKFSQRGIYSIIMYGVIKDEIIVDDYFPQDSNSKNLNISYEGNDITLAIIEKCLAKYYGSYEKLYQKAEELGELVLYSILFGMSHEIINIGIKEQQYPKILWDILQDFRKDKLPVKLRCSAHEFCKERFLPLNAEFALITTFSSTHVDVALLSDLALITSQDENLANAFQFKKNSYVWKIDNHDEIFCYDQSFHDIGLCYMSMDEISQNFDQIYVFHNLYPLHHKTINMRKEFMKKGDFYIFEIADFTDFHIEISQKDYYGYLGCVVYQLEERLKEESLEEVTELGVLNLSLRQAVRFKDGSLIDNLEPGKYLLRAKFRQKIVDSSFQTPQIYISSSTKLTNLQSIDDPLYSKKFKKINFKNTLKFLEKMEFKHSNFIYKGAIFFDSRIYAIIAMNNSTTYDVAYQLQLTKLKNICMPKNVTLSNDGILEINVPAGGLFQAYFKEANCESEELPNIIINVKDFKASYKKNAQSFFNTKEKKIILKQTYSIN